MEVRTTSHRQGTPKRKSKMSFRGRKGDKGAKVHSPRPYWGEKKRGQTSESSRERIKEGGRPRSNRSETRSLVR